LVVPHQIEAGVSQQVEQRGMVGQLGRLGIATPHTIADILHRQIADAIQRASREFQGTSGVEPAGIQFLATR
jgi:hypothetical protein